MMRLSRGGAVIPIVAAIIVVLLLDSGSSRSNAPMALDGMVGRTSAPEHRRVAHQKRDIVRVGDGPAGAAGPLFLRLSTAADAGDVRAACTLGMLLEMCANSTESEDVARSLLDAAASSESGGKDELLIMARVQSIENVQGLYRQFCESLGPVEAAQSHARMLQAVKLGSPHAAVRFFLQPELQTGSNAIYLTQATDHSRHAVDGLQRAAERGNALAMYTLFKLLATGEYSNNEVALNVDIQRGKAIALGRAVLPALNPYSAMATRELLQQLERQASHNERREAALWSSRFPLNPDASSLDGLPDIAEDVTHCGAQ